MLDDGPHAVAEAPDIVSGRLDAERNQDLHVRVFSALRNLVRTPLLSFRLMQVARPARDALTRHWAGYGYVTLQLMDTASTSEPRSANEETVSYLKADRRAPSGPAAWQSSPREISFLLDSLADLQNRIPALAGKIDADHIGVGGHSIGAFAADAIAGALVNLPGHVLPASPIRVCKLFCCFLRKDPANLALRAIRGKTSSCRF